MQLQKIAGMVLEQGMSQADVAELCNVTPMLVHKLVKTVRLAKHSYAALADKRIAKMEAHEQLVQGVKEFLESGRHIWTAQ